jgi:hypothetical protein
VGFSSCLRGDWVRKDHPRSDLEHSITNAHLCAWFVRRPRVQSCQIQLRGFTFGASDINFEFARPNHFGFTDCLRLQEADSVEMLRFSPAFFSQRLIFRSFVTQGRLACRAGVDDRKPAWEGTHVGRYDCKFDAGLETACCWLHANVDRDSSDQSEKIVDRHRSIKKAFSICGDGERL